MEEKTTKRMSVTFVARSLEQLEAEARALWAKGIRTSLADLVRLSVREHNDRSDAR